jgi:hypothetical protein
MSFVVERVVDEDGLGRTSLCIAGHYAEEQEPKEDSVVRYYFSGLTIDCESHRHPGNNQPNRTLNLVFSSTGW